MQLFVMQMKDERDQRELERNERAAERQMERSERAADRDIWVKIASKAAEGFILNKKVARREKKTVKRTKTRRFTNFNSSSSSSPKLFRLLSLYEMSVGY